MSSFPTAHVTWLKDGVPLSDVTAEISTSLRQLSETRWGSRSASTLMTAELMTSWELHSLTPLGLSLGFSARWARMTSVVIEVSAFIVLCSYMSVLTLIRAKEEDSGNYTMRVENGNQSRDVSLMLEVKGQETFLTFISLDIDLSHFCPLIFTHTLCWTMLQCLQSLWSWWTSTTAQPQASLWCVLLEGSPLLWWSGSSARTSNSKFSLRQCNIDILLYFSVYIHVVSTHFTILYSKTLNHSILSNLIVYGTHTGACVWNFKERQTWRKQNSLLEKCTVQQRKENCEYTKNTKCTKPGLKPNLTNKLLLMFP